MFIYFSNIYLYININLFFKLVTSGDSLPMVWSILSDEERESANSSVHRTEFYASKPFSTKICTVPNYFKFETELREEYKKETGLYIITTKIISYSYLSLSYK